MKFVMTLGDAVEIDVVQSIAYFIVGVCGGIAIGYCVALAAGWVRIRKHKKGGGK